MRFEKNAMKTDLLLSRLRNPYGLSEAEQREARLAAADEIEKWKDAYENLQAWVEKQGLNTTTEGRPVKREVLRKEKNERI